MISYFIDGIVLMGVAATGLWVWRTNRELKALRHYHAEYQRIFAETGDAIATIDMSIREIHANGAQIVLALGDRIDEANRVIFEVDERMDAVAQHFDAERGANVVQFAAPRPAARQPEPPPPQPEEYREPRLSAADLYRQPRAPEPVPQPQPQQRPVQWPSLGDRFSQWRQSETRFAGGQRS